GPIAGVKDVAYGDCPSGEAMLAKVDDKKPTDWVIYKGALTPETLNTGSSTATVSPVPTLTFDQAKIQALHIPYDLLFRNIDRVQGKDVYFEGQVIQVIPNVNASAAYKLRVNVTPN